MRRPFLAGNWKLNKNLRESLALATALKRHLNDEEDVDIAVCPPFVYLADVVDALRDTHLAVGAQDCYWEESGAFTGEVAPGMLKDIGCDYTLIGHSERRQYFGETDETVNRKILAALAATLKPIVCLGESLEQREAGVTHQVIETQLTGGLKGLTPDQAAALTLAYEPIWAIGTGRTASPEQANDVHGFIRQWLGRQFSGSVADAVRIQYGGSVKPANVAELMVQPEIDGALVGGASLEADSFAAIVRSWNGKLKVQDPDTK